VAGAAGGRAAGGRAAGPAPTGRPPDISAPYEPRAEGRKQKKISRRSEGGCKAIKVHSSSGAEKSRGGKMDYTEVHPQ